MSVSPAKLNSLILANERFAERLREQLEQVEQRRAERQEELRKIRGILDEAEKQRQEKEEHEKRKGHAMSIKRMSGNAPVTHETQPLTAARVMAEPFFPKLRNADTQERNRRLFDIRFPLRPHLSRDEVAWPLEQRLHLRKAVLEEERRLRDERNAARLQRDQDALQHLLEHGQFAEDAPEDVRNSDPGDPLSLKERVEVMRTAATQRFEQRRDDPEQDDQAEKLALSGSIEDGGIDWRMVARDVGRGHDECRRRWLHHERKHLALAPSATVKVKKTSVRKKKVTKAKETTALSQSKSAVASRKRRQQKRQLQEQTELLSKNAALTATAWSKEEKNKLSQLVQEHGPCGKWDLIAAELNTGRTPVTCLKEWTKRQKAARQGKFSPEEDAAVVVVVNREGDTNFEAIARHVPGRTPRQVWTRWYKYLRPQQLRLAHQKGLVDVAPKTGPWSIDEDLRVVLASRCVRSSEEAETKKLAWCDIAPFVPTRNDIQIRERYTSVLDPGLGKVRRGWSKADDKTLLELAKKYEHGWSKIARHFGNRTDDECRKRWIQVAKKTEVQAVSGLYAQKYGPQTLRKKKERATKKKPPAIEAAPVVKKQAPESEEDSFSSEEVEEDDLAHALVEVDSEEQPRRSRRITRYIKYDPSDNEEEEPSSKQEPVNDDEEDDMADDDEDFDLAAEQRSIRKTKQQQRMHQPKKQRKNVRKKTIKSILAEQEPVSDDEFSAEEKAAFSLKQEEVKQEQEAVVTTGRVTRSQARKKRLRTQDVKQEHPSFEEDGNDACDRDGDSSDDGVPLRRSKRRRRQASCDV
ncbi:MAG: hypothetical protein MHM6MM_003095 [Cercozoa sp. M6MM]